MRRRLLIIAAFLLAGAVVNVAVAWGCALWVPLKPWVHHRLFTLADQKDVRPVPQHVLAIHEQHRPPGGMWARTFGANGIGYDGYLIEVTDYDGHSYNTAAAQAGWPLRGFWAYHGAATESTQAQPNTRVVKAEWASGLLVERNNRWIPYSPLWPGIAVNTLFYAVILWLLIPGPFALRRLVRTKRGLCPKCAYPKGDSPLCTECGREHIDVAGRVTNIRDTWASARFFPWNQIPQLVHFSPKQRRRFFQYCLRDVSPFSVREAILSSLPTWTGIIAFYVILYGPAGGSVSPALTPAIAGASGGVLILCYFSIRRVRAAATPEVLDQYFARESKCPKCNYDLTHKNPMSTKCPECGRELAT